jgi:hypothetical protein
VAHVGQKLALGLVGGFRGFLGCLEFVLLSLALGDVPANRPHGDAAAGSRLCNEKYGLPHRDRRAGLLMLESRFPLPPAVPRDGGQDPLAEPLPVFIHDVIEQADARHWLISIKAHHLPPGGVEKQN